MRALILFVGAVVVGSAAVLADPPPLPADQSQVFSPDELLLIDSYPEEKQASAELALANAEPLPPLEPPPDFPEGVLVKVEIEYVYVTNAPPTKKTFQISPETRTPGGEWTEHPVTLEVSCVNTSQFWRLVIEPQGDSSFLVRPEYKLELPGTNVWAMTDIAFFIGGLGSNTEYRVKARLGEEYK